MTTVRQSPCPHDQLHDVAGVAARLDVSVKTVRRMIERGDLPVHRIGKLLRISEGDLADYLAKARTKPGEGAA